MMSTNERNTGTLDSFGANMKMRCEGLQGESMRVGIFESIVSVSTLDQKFEAVAGMGFSAVQLDLASVGLETVPDEIPEPAVTEIVEASNRHGIAIAALSGTFNMIDPDLSARSSNLSRLLGLIEFAPSIGTNVVTICTGTRNASSMWRRHPDNDSEEAWADLLESLAPALRAAEVNGVVLGVEPEPANVMSNAPRARRLIDEVGSAYLGIVADPANLLAGDRGLDPEVVLTNAFDLLGDRIVLAHAKDLGGGGEFCPAGTGIVPWSHFRRLLKAANYHGSVICHSLTVADVPVAIEALRGGGFQM